MKWNKAVKEIEEAIRYRVDVVVEYHVKHDTRQSRFEKVESISEYEYQGTKCKAINTYHDQVLEGLHVIDGIYVNLTVEQAKRSEDYNFPAEGDE